MTNTIGDGIHTILIVDDVKSNLYILSELLSDYTVLSTTDGKSAIDIVKKEKPDLILLDIVMPDMDGYEVCSKLKSIQETKNIPVIFATGNMDDESIEKAYSVGGIDYVTKPFKPKELLARVKTQIDYAEIQKSLEEKIKLIDKNVSYSSTDENGIIIDVSEAFCAITGYSRDKLIGKNHNILRHKDMDKKVYTELWDTITKGKSWKGEVKNKKKDGLCYWANVVITPILDNRGKIIRYTAIRHDISNQKRVETLSVTDQLTNLYNRRHFDDMLPIEVRRCIRQATYLSFAMLDIDYFKEYNDTYGHQAGDNVLSRLGELLQNKLARAEDLIFRLGGEEFGLIFTSSNPESSKKIVENIRKAVIKLNIEHENSKVAKHLTVSIGLICVDCSKEENQNLDEDIIYKLADDELYKAKSEGRDRVSISSI